MDNAAVQSFLPVLRDLADWWLAEELDAFIIGGLAVAVLAEPRMTRDIDAVALVPESEWDPLVESARRHGFQLRTDDALSLMREGRVLLLRHQSTGIDLDLSLGILPFEYTASGRAAPVRIGEVEVRICSPEDLVVMKIVAHRPRDLEDIRSLARSHPEMDWDYVLTWAVGFAAALDAPEILSTLDRLRRESS